MEPKNLIFINGVDVSGCEYCLKMTKYRCTIQRDIYKCLCEENPNCYYKQLQRKEQECERWKKANDEKNELLAKMGCPTVATAKRNVFTLQQQIDKLKAENEKLKNKFVVYDQN